MNLNQMMRLSQDIQCGKYRCLASCCSETSLTEIFYLMRSIGETDIPRLQAMLCGCAVSAAPGTTINEPNQNCTDTIVRYVCSSRTTVNGIANVLSGLAVALPTFSPILAPIAAFLKDLLDGCAQSTSPPQLPATTTGIVPASNAPITTASSWVDGIMDRICGYDAWASSLLQKNLPAALASVIDTIRQWMTPINAAITLCCSQRRVSNPWPDVSVPSTPALPDSSTPVTPSQPQTPTGTGSGTGGTGGSKSYVPVTVAVPVTPATVIYPGRRY